MFRSAQNYSDQGNQVRKRFFLKKEAKAFACGVRAGWAART
jgi:hypothetical protein